MVQVLSRGRLSFVLAMSLLAGTASADLPSALDRAPKGAAVTIGFRNVQHLREGIEGLLRKFEPNALEGLAEFDQLVDAEGFNKTGSAAFVLQGDPSAQDFEPDSNMVVILPISDWAKFSKAMGGEEGKKETMLSGLHGSLARDIGGGFAVIGPEPAVQSFKEVSGQIVEHKAMLGGTGMTVGDSADVVAFLNVALFKTQIDEMLEEMKGQAEMAAAMMGGGNPDAEANIQKAVKGMESAARDAQSLVFGVTFASAGVSGDMAVQFKEGTESAKSFTHSGSVGDALGSLPKMPFLAAYAFDATHPMVRGIMAQAAKNAGGGAAMGGMFSAMEKVDAMAFVLGSNPALLSSGLFAKALTFEKTSDPAAVLAAKRQAMGKVSMEKDGMKIEASLTPDAETIAGQKVDRYKAKIEIDPNSPMAQAQQFLGLITGPSGELGGMITAGKRGVLTTMSPNTELMTKAIQAQNGDGSLANDADFKAVAAMLPANRAFEAYLGVKGIADTAAGVTQMFGQALPVEFKEELPPIGFGMTAGTGGLGARLVVPTKVIDALAEVAKKMKEAEEGEGEGAKPEEKPGERRKPRL